jgi:LysR family transcriptional regulator, pca operon transcriptional activator
MIDRRIKFRHIQCFVEIQREGSFKIAAARLNLTQSAISKTLKELEDIIDARLLRRSRSGVALTRQGEVFLHFAQMSLASLQQALDGVAQEGRAEKEKLVVGALPSVAAWLLPRVAARLAATVPGTMLSVVEGPHAYLTERLRVGAVDLVIGRLASPEAMQGVSFTQLYNEEVVFVVRPGHPLLDAPELSRIGDWPVIYPPEGAAIRPLVERFLVANGVGRIDNRLESVSGAFGRIHTRTSDAVWIISHGVVAHEIADGRLVRLPFDTGLTAGPVGLMLRSGAAPRPVVQVFERVVQAVIAETG